MFKKLTGFLLAILMILGTVSMVAFADSTDDKTTGTLYDTLLTGLRNMEDRIDISEYEIDLSDKEIIQKTYSDVMNYNPKLFYLTSNSQVESLSGKFTTYIPEYAMTKEEVAINQVKLDDEIKRIKAGIPDGISDLEIILAVNDYLAISTKYDWDAVSGGIYHASAYHALIKKVSVCQGYVHAFMLIMEEYGIEYKYVTSDAMKHAWNMVKLDGEWYHIDVTWNDPAEPDRLGVAAHEFFLISDNAIWYERDTEHDGWSAELPDCTDTTYDDAFWVDVRSQFIYKDGKWYFTYSDDYNKHYIKSYDFTTNEMETVLDISTIWYYGEDHAWPISPLLATYDGKLYYNTYDKIFSVNFDGTEIEEIFSMDYNNYADGIYELVINDNVLTYGIMNGPRDEDEKIKQDTIILSNTKIYTVTFKDGEEIIDTQYIEEGQSAVLPPDPVKDFYDFVGWDVELPEVITEDITLNAVWEAKAVETNKRRKGFITNDGKNSDISISDAIEIFRHLADKKILSGDNAWAADIDWVNGITISDAIWIFRYLASKVTYEQFPKNPNIEGDWYYFTDISGIYKANKNALDDYDSWILIREAEINEDEGIATFYNGTPVLKDGWLYVFVIFVSEYEFEEEIYYDYDYKLARIREEGSDLQIFDDICLTESNPDGIGGKDLMQYWIYGDYIHYMLLGYDEEYNITSEFYRANDDGTDNTLLSDLFVVAVDESNQNIFYIQESDPTEGIYSLYRSKIDGSESVLVISEFGKLQFYYDDDYEEMAFVMEVRVDSYGEWIYYSPLNENIIYRMKFDGSENTILFESDFSYGDNSLMQFSLDIQTGTIYFYEYFYNELSDEEHYNTYSMNFDGSDLQLLYSEVW